MTRGSAYILVLGALVSAPSVASADACVADAEHCLTRPVDYTWQSANGLNVMLDTGWVPNNSPLQVRIYLAATGYASAKLAGDIGASWPSPITVGFDPSGQGFVTVDYGFALTLQFRFHVTVLGQDIDWSGDIPIPGLPSDLRMNATQMIDDFVLVGATPRPVTLADATGNIRVLDVNVLGSIIPIPGLSGGIALDARASLEAQYVTDRVTVANGLPSVITSEGGFARRHAPPGGDYGPAIDIRSKPSGTIDQVFGVVLSPTIYLDIFGFGFSQPVFELPIDVLDTTTTVAFNERTTHFPLADIADVEDVDFGSVAFGTAGSASVGLTNEGEAELLVTIVSLPPGVTAETGEMLLGSGQTDTLALELSGNVLGEVSGEIVLATNDPDSPEVIVGVHGNVHPTGSLPDGGADGAVEDGGFIDGGTEIPREGAGCGCRTAGSRDPSHAAVIALGLCLAFAARRARRARRAI